MTLRSKDLIGLEDLSREEILAVEGHGAAEHFVAGLAHQDARQRALPGTIGAQQSNHLTTFYLQADRIDNPSAGIDFNQIFQIYCSHQFLPFYRVPDTRLRFLLLRLELFFTNRVIIY